MKLAVLNDLHLGVNRKTPYIKELHAYVQGQLSHLLEGIECDLLINGDLFDTFDPPADILLDTFYQFSRWLQKGYKLYLGRGNHDVAKDSSKLSGISLLAKLLQSHYEGFVFLIEDTTYLYDGKVVVIPHLENQEAFDAALASVPSCDYLFLHANYDNKFAVQSDHSLNVSEAQAKAAPCGHIIFGHEHQAKVALAGKVQIAGNQIITSVADCLGNSTKQYIAVEDSGITLNEVGKVADCFSQVDWKSFTIPNKWFLRITGKATAEEAAEVVANVARIRAASTAFVVTNAVEITQSTDEFSLTDSVEKLGNFNVMEALKEFLTADEMEKVNRL